MIKVKLIRVDQDTFCTRGVLIVEGEIFTTLERPWLNNERNISCIPFGFYRCSRRISEKYGECWEVNNVTGRSAVLFHSGNTARDSRGCILVGMRFGKLGGDSAVLASRSAMNRMRALLYNSPFFDLEIHEVF